VNLRPLGIGELLDAAIRVCIAHRWTLVKIVLFVVVPVQVLSVIVTASTTPEGMSANPLDFSVDEEATVDDQDLATFFAGQLAVLLLSMIIFLLGTGACFRALTQAWLGEEPEWRESLRFALRRTPALLWVSVAYFLAVFLGFLLLIVPGVWASFAFALCFPIVLVERIGGFKALRRSARLVRGRWWATFAALMVGFVLASVLSGIAQAAIALPVVIAVDSGLATLIFTAIGGTLGYVIATPFQAAIVALAYFDLRVRKEGLDLQLVAERLGAAAPAAPAAPAAAPAEPAGAATVEGVPGSFEPAPAQGPAEAFGSASGPPQAERPPASGWLPPTPDR